MGNLDNNIASELIGIYTPIVYNNTVIYLDILNCRKCVSVISPKTRSPLASEMLMIVRIVQQ